MESTRRSRGEGYEWRAGRLGLRVGRVGDGAQHPRADGLERRAGRLERGAGGAEDWAQRPGAEGLELELERRADQLKRDAGGIGEALRAPQDRAVDGRRGDGGDVAMGSGEARSGQDEAGERAGIPKPRKTGTRPRGRRGGGGGSRGSRVRRRGGRRRRAGLPPAGSRERPILTGIFLSCTKFRSEQFGTRFRPNITSL